MARSKNNLVHEAKITLTFVSFATPQTKHGWALGVVDASQGQDNSKLYNGEMLDGYTAGWFEYDEAA